ncbi:hypothetical protein Hypma_009094 [Hypsizygus marmoreus]|uniref:Uncharacterized protein n=1 Tax=Hypsizygus marmoreus TaxID=39966 RepID=A0A369JPH1_HYPMA|nr:hypothetical protein Hypma_009094 [Hypsizygus marmoreus]
MVRTFATELSATAEPIPKLPSELIEIIISELWLSSLSTDERVILMTSSRMVGRTWAHAVIRASFQDVFIPCSSYLRYYKRIVDQSVHKHDGNRSLVRDLCQSLTMQKHSTPPRATQMLFDGQCEGNPLAPPSLRHFMDALYVIPHLPNIRILSLEYSNPDHNGDHFVSFSIPITSLELKYIFNPRTPAWLIEAMISNEDHQNAPWTLPPIRHISIIGDVDLVVAGLLAYCPALAHVEFIPIQVEVMSPATIVTSQVILHQPLPELAVPTPPRSPGDSYELRGRALGIGAQIISKRDGSWCRHQTTRTVRLFQRSRP